MDVPKTKEFFDMMFTIKEKKASFLEDVADCITMTVSYKIKLTKWIVKSWIERETGYVLICNHCSLFRQQAAPASFISRSMHQLPIARMMGEGMLKISEFFRCIKVFINYTG